MLTHGLPKLERLISGDVASFPSVFGMSPALSLILAVLAEVVCSIFLILGLGTRLVMVPLIITMLVAVFHIHGSDPFSKQEMGLHYLITYCVLLIIGPGKYSLDYRMETRKMGV